MNKPQNKTNKVLPHKASDHDERGESLAVDKPWLDDERPRDAAMAAGKHANSFAADDVPLSDEDWEKEEKLDDNVPDHIDRVVDASLESLAEEEMADEDDE